MENVSPSPLIKQEHSGTSTLAITTSMPGRPVQFPPAVYLPPPAPPPRHSFCHPAQDDVWQLPGRLRINPSLWDKEDVAHWLHWAQREYALRRPESGHFQMNGRALCLLTKEDFRRRCPSSGDVLYELLQCVKQQRNMVPAPLNSSNHPHAMQTPPSHAQQPLLSQPPFNQTIPQPTGTNGTAVWFSSAVSVCPPVTSEAMSPLRERTSPHYTHPTKHTHTEVSLAVPVLTHLQAQSPPTVSRNKEEPLNLSNRERIQMAAPLREANGKIPECRLLWDYVYQLLSDQRYQAFIRWEDQDTQVFRVVDPNGLARLWGNHKNRANMTYEKMSRALRHYYKLNIIKKEPGQKLLFRFLKTPEEIRKHRTDSTEQSPEHTPPLNEAMPEHTPSRAYSLEGLEVSPESASSPLSDLEA